MELHVSHMNVIGILVKYRLEWAKGMFVMANNSD